MACGRLGRLLPQHPPPHRLRALTATLSIRLWVVMASPHSLPLPAKGDMAGEWQLCVMLLP